MQPPVRIPVHLGSGEQGERRKAALQRLAARAGFIRDGVGNISAWLVSLADGEIDRYEVSGRWITIPEAVELAAERLKTLEPRTVRYAAERGHIDGAKRRGRDWLLPEGSFLGWLTDRPKPGPKPSPRQEEDPWRNPAERLRHSKEAD
jgi:hypothetical protein